ncbi:MAG TPA: NUDIX domain-containing protein [Rhizorhapis sp.]
MNDLPPARAAATLIIFRDREDSPAELLMMERSRKMDFAAGALVFPGGAVDEADAELAAAHGGGLAVDEAAARIAAIRETLEESGLVLGLRNCPDADLACQIRERMKQGESFAALLGEYGLELDLAQFVPFARWLPNVRPRNYDTRFYLARLPVDSHAPCVDATENVRLFWASARDVLDRAGKEGEAHVIFPTRRNLERLAQFSDYASAAAHARSFGVRTITPWIEERTDGRHLCIPDDLGYPVTSESVTTALRG